MVPGRDYPMTQLSALKSVLRTGWRGGERQREGLGSDKVERGTDSDMEGRLRVTERGGGGHLTHFLSLSQRTGMLGWMTNPKNPNGCSIHTYTHTVHPRPADRCPFHYIIITPPVNTPAICNLITSPLSPSLPMSSAFTFSFCHFLYNFSPHTKPFCLHRQA